MSDLEDSNFEEAVSELRPTLLQDDIDDVKETVATLQQNLSTFRAQKKEIQQMITQEKTFIKEAQSQVDVFRAQGANLRADYEFGSSRKQGLVWHLLAVLLAACMFHSYAQRFADDPNTFRVYFFTALNAYGFLLNWRKLYIIKSSPLTTGVCAIIVAVTIWVG